MLEVISNSLPIFLSVFIGYLLVSKKFVPKDASKTIGTIAFYIAGPALIFSTFYGLRFERENILIFLAPIALQLILIICAFILGRILSLSNKQKGALVLCMILFGSGVVYPFVTQNFSEEIFQTFVTVDILQFILYLLIAPVIGVYLGSKYGKKTKVNLKDMLLKIFKDPFLLTMLITLILTYSGLKIPSFLIDTSEYFAKSFFFLIALFVGMILVLPSLKDIYHVGILYISRLGIVAIFLYLFINIFSLNELQITSSILVFSAPFALITVVYSKEYGLDSEFATKLVLFSLVAQLVVYPVLITGIKQFI